MKGYYRNDGTFVQPHHRTSPDNSINNNWSTKGNVNPYTGQEGWIDRQPTYSNVGPPSISFQVLPGKSNTDRVTSNDSISGFNPSTSITDSKLSEGGFAIRKSWQDDLYTMLFLGALIIGLLWRSVAWLNNQMAGQKCEVEASKRRAKIKAIVSDKLHSLGLALLISMFFAVGLWLFTLYKSLSA